MYLYDFFQNIGFNRAVLYFQKTDTGQCLSDEGKEMCKMSKTNLYNAAIYLRLSKEDGDVAEGSKIMPPQRPHLHFIMWSCKPNT